MSDAGSDLLFDTVMLGKKSQDEVNLKKRN